MNTASNLAATSSITHHDPAHWPNLLLAPRWCPDLLAVFAASFLLVFVELHRRARTSGRGFVATLAATPLVSFCAASTVGIVLSTLMVCFAPRYMAQAVPLIYVLMGVGLFGGGGRETWKYAALAGLIALNLYNQDGRLFPNIDDGPAAQHSEPEKARERSLEYRRYHASNLHAARLLEAEYSDEAMIVSAPFGHMLYQPSFGYVARPLNVACAGMQRSVFPFTPSPQEAGRRDAIYIRDRYADPATIAPPEPGDEILLDDKLSPPLLIYRKRWKGEVPQDPMQIESWFSSRGWIGRSIVEQARHRTTALRDAGRTSQAEAELRRLTTSLPSRSELRVLLVGFLIAEGKTREAEGELQKASKEFPKDAWFVGSLGRLRLSEGRVAEAVDPLETAARLAPQSVDVLGGLAELRDRQGKAAEALQLYHSLATATSDLQWSLRKGDVLLRMGRPAEALPMLEAVHAATPKDLGVQRLRAEALLGVGRAAEAAEILQVVVQAVPQNADARYSLAFARYRLGRIEESLALLRPLIAEPRKGPTAKNLMAWILATHPDEKFRDAAQAVQLAEDVWKQQGGKDPGVLDTLAAAYANAGRFTDAAAVQLRCLQLLGPTASSERLVRTRRRIELYRSQSPYREAPGGAGDEQE